MEKINNAMSAYTDNFYLSKEEPHLCCLLALRSIILKQDAHITETQKYGMPCFCYHNKIFCYLWTDKKKNEPYIMMVEGKYIDHPALESGNRWRMKILRVDSMTDFPIDTIVAVLELGLNLYKNGIVKI